VISTFDLTMIKAILPEIFLVLLGIIIVIVDLTTKEEQKGVLGWISAAGLFFIIIISLLFALPGDQSISTWGGMIRYDWLSFVFMILFLFGAGITSLLAMDIPNLGRRGELYLLLLASTLGMCLMASSADLVMLYLAIETTSIPMYILAGFMTQEKKSTEAGFKYLLFGALTSAILLYGFSLIYGFTGTTNIYSLAEGFSKYTNSLPIIGAFLLVLVGFGFKVAVFPFHFWAPDVYEGAPTPITGFLSTASKAAGFAVLIRFLIIVYPEYTQLWSALLAALAVATMTLGNLMALTQKNMKRMLAYSSIAHAGYITIGVVAASQEGFSAVIFYLIAYLLTNLAVFGAVSVISRTTGSDEISSYAGLSRRAPGISLVLLVGLLSLAGMPPLGGFIAKFLIFASAVNAGMIWLAVIGVLNSIIGLYYYLIVLKVIYLYRSDDENSPLPIPKAYVLALFILTFGIILVGTIFAPWFSWVTQAAAAMF